MWSRKRRGKVEVESEGLRKMGEDESESCRRTGGKARTLHLHMGVGSRSFRKICGRRQKRRRIHRDFSEISAVFAQPTEDPFGDGPFKAIPQENFPNPMQSSAPVASAASSFPPSASSMSIAEPVLPAVKMNVMSQLIFLLELMWTRVPILLVTLCIYFLYIPIYTCIRQ
ncbi:hypothetical protein KFK09_010837 [Dendrobium nobile]|uniref:Uncharacterized protein n=1 Tax=Dendrobium nobile TaxID=94219 RepID=A0A8T3BB51_DENNO|nr:hypothetical protein KFK09_010837 [Dendrobium nobile]